MPLPEMTTSAFVCKKIVDEKEKRAGAGTKKSTIIARGVRRPSAFGWILSANFLLICLFVVSLEPHTRE